MVSMRAFSSSSSRVELRAHPREQVNRPVKVLDGPFAIDATIRDISAGGMRLAFHGRNPSADEFVVADVNLAIAYACKVVWRKGPECGVRTLKSQDLRGLVPGQFDPAKRLWQFAGR
jgi:hypothetical protein